MSGLILSRAMALAGVFCLSCEAGYLQLNSLALDTTRFNVTPFATGLARPLSAVELFDQSIALASYGGGIQRFTDTNHDGLADAAGTTLYAPAIPGPHLGLVNAGSYLIDAKGNDFLHGSQNGQAITILKPGATADTPFTTAGVLQLSYPTDWEHNTPGIATRPTPGHPGSYDLVFNIGAEFDHQLSTDKVQLSGLATATLDGDSLYALTLDLSGATPRASNVRKVASGIRNVIGMGFQPGTGDFYFADNAIDGPGADGDEPPQAEELNRIVAADFDHGAAMGFGYPNCYIGYRTGATVGSGCVQPYFAFQPLPNGTALGSESEGVTQLAFAPPDFPSGFNNGIFFGFSGKGTVTGAANEENAVGFYDFGSGTYIHFSENSQNGVYQPIGLLATRNALYISDFGSGVVYEVTAAPEPTTMVLLALAMAAIPALRKHAFGVVLR